MQVLRIGSSGPDVMQIQQALNRCMLPPNNKFTSPPLKRLVEDQNFGTKTDAMVREFQRLNKVTVDGAVGPITSYLILPFISFTATLAGKGRIRGRRDGGGQLGVRLPAPRVPFGAPTRFGAAKAKDAPQGGGTADQSDDDEEGITVDVSVGSGNGTAFKPWFVLKPNGEAEGSEAEGSISIDSTILRKKGFEFGGGLQISRPLAVQGAVWQWGGSISGSYTNLKVADGLFSLTPIVDASVKEGLNLGAGIGAEASVNLFDDAFQLTVGGKVAADLDPHEGSLQVGGAISAGMKFKWEVVRFGKKQ
jgi:peptidoglycan hydrolase-like protein with peptidoglycan-binding domain